MSLAQKMQQGGSTPTLYSFYGKQYDYNDLAQAADQGLNEYLQTLKRGEKDSSDFRNAYTNLMSGIKDGSITFDNGQFHDSKGRYTNSDKKNKDYYGLIANYIYGKMGKSNVYKKPDDPSKIKWGNDSVRTALMRQLFNSDSGNVKDFLDLDQEKNGVRSIANRSTYLSNALQSVADNWDNTFQDYGEADKSKYIPLLVNAAKSLRDGTIDPGDYLALSKAVGGMDFREMMATGTPTVQEKLPQQVQQPQQPPQMRMKHASLADQSYDTNTISRMTSVMTRVPTKGLINILRNSFYNKYYRFGSDPRISQIFGSSSISSKAGVTATLNALQAQGVLKNADPSNPNLYYIPGLKTKNGTGWVWDKANNTITEMLLQNIPYTNEQMQQGNFTTYVNSHKLGGVLIAQQGAKLPWYSNLQDFDASKFQSKWGSTLYGIDDKGQYGQPYGNSGMGTNEFRYKTDSRFQDFSTKGRDYAQQIENQTHYKNFTNSLLQAAKEYTDAGDKSTFNDDNNVFLRWAHLVDQNLPKNSKSTFFDSDGKLRSSWQVTNKDSYGRGPRETISNLSNYINSIRNDQLLANRHNDLMREGTRYFYNDVDGNKHWVDPEVAKSGKYQISTNGIKSVDGINNWTDYELTGITPDTSEQTNGSAINPTQQPESKPSWIQQNGVKLAQDIAPLAVGASRLFDSLHTNNKVADVIRRSIKPVLKNTYELYSPVTGAFSEMQLRNRQAADLRRQAAQPYTSDASLNAARSLDANRQANDLQYQGFLADDKEILRTKQEALKRQEDNIARRADTANFNRASINQANRERAQVEAGRLKSNWQSRDNFLSGVESDLKQKNAQRDYDRRVELAENRQRSLSLDMDDMNRPYSIKSRNLEQQYQDSINDMSQEFNAKLAEWQSVHGEDADYTSQPFYKDYISKQRAIRDKYYTDQDALAEEQARSTRQYIDGLRNRMNQSTLFKRGGKLSLSTINLLHKVMK